MAGLAWLPSSTVEAAELAIPIDTAISSGVAVGERVELLSIPALDLEGSRCDVRAARRPQDVTNAGNDLIVRSGGGRTVLTDVERTPGAVTEGPAITIGPRITIVLRMGPDERFAAGIDVEFDCGTEPSTMVGVRLTVEGGQADPQGIGVAALEDDEVLIEGQGIASGLLRVGSYTLLEDADPDDSTPSTWECSNGSVRHTSDGVGELEVTAADVASGRRIDCVVRDAASLALGTQAPAPRARTGGVEAPEELPATGLEPAATLSLAVALLAFGTAATVAARRPGFPATRASQHPSARA